MEYLALGGDYCEIVHALFYMLVGDKCSKQIDRRTDKTNAGVNGVLGLVLDILVVKCSDHYKVIGRLGRLELGEDQAKEGAGHDVGCLKDALGRKPFTAFNSPEVSWAMAQEAFAILLAV